MTETATTHPASACDTAAAAIVIPAHGQPGLLIEAVESALLQSVSVEIVIVDDGCPYSETAILAASYELAHSNVTFLRQRNSGLSAARNRGIAYVLAHCPSVEAIHFLDADNRLSPASIASSLAILRKNEEIGWVYPDIDRFGISASSSHAGAYSPLLQIAFENICEAGSLVSRKVFEAGIRFDETLREGCEDWDFWLLAQERGFTGIHDPHAGFEYRRRAESLVAATKRVYPRLREQIRARHPSLYNYDALIGLEHAQAPRFCRICPNSGAGIGFSDPNTEGRHWSAADLRDLAEAESSEPDRCGPPPQLVWMPDAAFTKICDLRIAWSLFHIVERYLANFDFIAIKIEPDAGQLGFAFSACEGEALGREPVHGLVISGSRLRSWAEAGGSQSVPADAKGMRLTLHGPVNRHTCQSAHFSSAKPVADWLATLSRALRQRWTWRAPHLPEMAERSRLIEGCLEIEHPQCRVRGSRRPQVALALPFVAYGGVERVAFAVAKELTAAGCDVHLFVFGQIKIPLRPQEKIHFASINMLAEPGFAFHGGQSLYLGEALTLAADRQAMTRRLQGLLAGMDVVINSHVATLNAAAMALRANGTRFISHLHVIDETDYGRPSGLAHGALAFEHVHDSFLTCSEQLADWLCAMGVPSGKIVTLPNAPALARAGLGGTGSTVRDIKPASQPLRVLFLGRFDRQKGIERLLGMIAESQRRRIFLQWRVVGAAVVDHDCDGKWRQDLRALGVEPEPPLWQAQALEHALAQADILVMPSRWEGAPLTVLEAQQAGCVPIATDVGALPELITRERDGVLLADGDDAAVIAAFITTLAALEGDRSRLAAMAANAQVASAQRTWKAGCMGLIKLIERWFPGLVVD